MIRCFPCQPTLTNECIIRDRVIHSQVFFFIPKSFFLSPCRPLAGDVSFSSSQEESCLSLFLARPAQKTTAQQLVLDESDRENVAVIHPFPNNIVKRMLCQYCNYSITVFMNYDTAITTCFHPPSLLSLADVVAFSLVVVLVRWDWLLLSPLLWFWFDGDW